MSKDDSNEKLGMIHARKKKIVVGNDIDIVIILTYAWLALLDGWIQNAFPTTFKYHSLNPKPFSLYPSQIDHQKRRKIIRWEMTNSFI